MAKQITINNCYDCPFHKGKEYSHFCTKTGLYKDGTFIDEHITSNGRYISYPEKIPEWCMLEDSK